MTFHQFIFKNLESIHVQLIVEVSRYVFQPAFLSLSVRTDFINLLKKYLVKNSNVPKKQQLFATDTRTSLVLS